MRRWHGVVSAAAAACLAPALGGPAASADSPEPQPGSSCPAELSGAMTLLPDRTDFLVCEGSWTPAAVPFPPNDKWLSVGPAMTLHGEGMRNPNLRSGQWTGTPRDPTTTCAAEQLTIVRAGVLAPPQDSRGVAGQPLSVQVLPRLFSIELSGDCLWSRDDAAGGAG